MVTFTFPHQKHMPLVELLLKQRQAFIYLRKGKQWDKFKSKNAFDGLIRSLEITYGFIEWLASTYSRTLVCSDKVDEVDFVDYVKKNGRGLALKQVY